MLPAPKMHPVRHNIAPSHSRNLAGTVFHHSVFELKRRFVSGSYNQANGTFYKNSATCESANEGCNGPGFLLHTCIYELARAHLSRVNYSSIQ